MQKFAVKAWAVFSVLGILQCIPCASAVINLGIVEVSTIGHSFVTNSVTDLLVDQDQSSGGGGEIFLVLPVFSGDNQFELTISAPPGKQFLVQVPTGEEVRFGGWIKWGGSSPPAPPFGGVAVTFSDLGGTPPGFSGSRSWLTDGGPLGSPHSFGFENIESDFLTNDLSFTSITLTATVPVLAYGFIPTLYYPASDSAFGLYYITPATNDPGPFVSLVSAPLPGVNILPQPNGDIAITFTGVLQYAGEVNGAFADVPGNPRGTYTISKADLSAQQYFRARGR